MSESFAALLAGAGMQVSAPPAPAGSYVPAVRAAGLVWTAGQLPLVDGALPATGLVGRDVSADDAAALARIAAANAVMALGTVMEPGEMERIVKVTGYVASAPGFTAQPQVLNGASDLLVEVFGDAGRHARAAVGVAELPLGSPVEVEIQVALRA